MKHSDDAATALPFICTACAARFALRRPADPKVRPGTSLEEHWDARPDCRRALGNPVGKFGVPPFPS